MYEKYGDIEVAIQNGDDGGEYCGCRETENIKVDGKHPNREIVIW